VHGLIFASLNDYLRDRFGTDAAEDVFQGRFYALAAAHPDAELVELVERGAERAGLETEEFLRDLGAFTSEHTFSRLYPTYFLMASDTVSFLLGVEDRIHELIRATIPNATPPTLTVRRAGPSSVGIEYASPRRLCRLLEGLVEGTASHYGEQAEIVETTCMHKGSDACRFEIEITPAVIRKRPSRSPEARA
jgi:hypothetical protein